MLAIFMRPVLQQIYLTVQIQDRASQENYSSLISTDKSVHT